MQQQFSSGEKITVIHVSGMCITVKSVMTIKGQDAKGWYGTYPGKKKPFYVPMDGLIFRGNTIPYQVDSDSDSFFGNNCINFMSKEDPESIRTWIKANNINQSFTAWDDICLCNGDTSAIEPDYQPLFSEQKLSYR